MKLKGIWVLLCLMRIYYFNGTQEIIFNPTIEQYFRLRGAVDVAMVEYIQTDKVKFSSGR